MLLKSGDKDFCSPYLQQLQASNHPLKTVKNSTGIIRHGLSHLANFADMEMGLVIPLDSVTQFESALWEGVYLTLLWMSGILAILLFMGSRLISREIIRLTSHASLISKGEALKSPLPRSHIKEFEVIADTFNDLFESQSQAIAAEAANQAKGQFLANVSHEIRTPINSIMNYARIMQTPGNETNHPRFIDNIFQSSEYLLLLINDLLDFSKVEAGYLTLGMIDFQLNSVLGQLRNSLATKAFNKNIELILDVTWVDDHQLVGDPHRLYQVLVNLRDNAIKFTRQGHVILRIRPIKEDSSQVKLLFEVEDTGGGIKKQNQQNIFEVFSQEDGSISRQLGGAGLGLPIVKQLVALMGGEICLESDSRAGSRFYFELSFTKARADTPKLCDVSVLKNTTTIVSVRHEVARGVIASMLSALGIHYMFLSDESALKAYFRSNSPCDIFIVDWQDEQQTDINWVRMSHEVSPSRPHHYSLVLTRPGRIYGEDDARWVSKFLDKPTTLSELHDALIGLYGENVKQEFSGLPTLQASLLDFFKGKRILVVDDNTTNQEITCILLDQAGVITDIADSGRRCLEKIKRNTYDLILMDVQMPDMDGLEATQNLRHRWDSKQLPIVGLSAHAMEKDRLSCLSAGMNDYLTKPLDPQKLYSSLQKNLPKGKALPIPPPIIEEVSKIEGVLPAELPGIDIQLGLAKLGNLKASYRRVLLSFYKTHKDDIDGFEQLTTVGDWKGVQAAAHKLVGSSSSIGAVMLCSLCVTLETADLEEPKEGLTEQVRSVVSELEKVLVGLSNKLSV